MALIILFIVGVVMVAREADRRTKYPNQWRR